MRPRAALALTLTLSLALSGCSPLLAREYSSVTLHKQLPVTEDESAAVWAENYQQLVAAILYQVSLHRSESVVRLRNYKGDVGAGLTRACQEVSGEDPLGAYVVDSISHDFSRIVTYYEATITISYRRSEAQQAAVTTLTGSGALRKQLRENMQCLAPEAAILVRNLPADADEAYVRALLAEAYGELEAPNFALPEVDIQFYPEVGMQRLVEVLFAYPPLPPLGPDGLPLLGEDGLPLPAKDSTQTASALLPKNTISIPNSALTPAKNSAEFHLQVAAPTPARATDGAQFTQSVGTQPIVPTPALRD